MSQLVLEMPESLRQRLEEQARAERTPIQEYVLYLLTRDVAAGYSVQPVPTAETARQKADYAFLLAGLGQASFGAIEAVLEAREGVPSEEGLNPRAVEALRRRLPGAPTAQEG